jgi:hypothetical protein
MPAIQATPDGSPSAGLIQESILFRQQIDVIPDGANWTGVEGFTLAPGESWVQGTTAGEGLGAMLYRLEAGTVTVRAAAPFTLTRAGSSATEAPKDTDIVLEPGDVVFLPVGVTSEWRNDGAAPATLMDAGIESMSPPTKPADYYYDAFPSTWPPTPVELTLRRRTLPPGGHLPITAEPGLAYLGLEPTAPDERSGRLTIVWSDFATPTSGVASLAAPREQRLNPPATAAPKGYLTDLRRYGASRVVQELRNDSDAPVTFLVLTITPIGAAASDEQQATPTT